MPSTKFDGRAIEYGIGAEPWDVRRELHAVFTEVEEYLARWEGITCDIAGLSIQGRLRIDGVEVPLFITVEYHYGRGGWTQHFQQELANYLDRIGLNTYLRQPTGDHRFLVSVEPVQG
jgi:hypothetical protein